MTKEQARFWWKLAWDIASEELFCDETFEDHYGAYIGAHPEESLDSSGDMADLWMAGRRADKGPSLAQKLGVYSPETAEDEPEVVQDPEEGNGGSESVGVACGGELVPSPTEVGYVCEECAAWHSTTWFLYHGKHCTAET